MQMNHLLMDQMLLNEIDQFLVMLDNIEDYFHQDLVQESTVESVIINKRFNI